MYRDGSGHYELILLAIIYKILGSFSMHARAQSDKNPEKSAIFKEAAIALIRLKKLVKSNKSKYFLS